MGFELKDEENWGVKGGRSSFEWWVVGFASKAGVVSLKTEENQRGA